MCLPWGTLCDKPFQNMGVSSAARLADTFPGHVGAWWLEHAEQIAEKRYRQVTEYHFDRAANCAAFLKKNID